MEAVADRGNAACAGGQNAGRAVGLYQRRRPAETVLYQLVQEHLETFLALADDPTGPRVARVYFARACLRLLQALLVLSVPALFPAREGAKYCVFLCRIGGKQSTPFDS